MSRQRLFIAKRLARNGAVLFSALFVALDIGGAVHSAPVFDGTTGGQAASSVAGPTIDVSQGTRSGGNVFNSFQSFSIGSGETVTFTDAANSGGVNNIINRVTGPSISEIDGTLASTVAGADIYLINPNGIVMGSGSVVDVPAGFHLSTANELRFADGTALQMNVGNSSFSSAAPQAFGFTGAPVGDITLTEAQIIGKPGANISLIGGNIKLQDGSVAGLDTRVETTGGTINIVGVEGSSNVPVDPTAPGLNVTTYGDVTISGGATAGQERSHVGTTVYNDAIQADISIRGDTVTVDNSDIDTITNGSTHGGSIRFAATGDVHLQNAGRVFTTNAGAGGGNIDIDGQYINIVRSVVGTMTTSGAGNAGDIAIHAVHDLFVSSIDPTLWDNSFVPAGYAGLVAPIGTTSLGWNGTTLAFTGKTGDINLTAENITLANTSVPFRQDRPAPAPSISLSPYAVISQGGLVLQVPGGGLQATSTVHPGSIEISATDTVVVQPNSGILGISGDTQPSCGCDFEIVAQTLEIIGSTLAMVTPRDGAFSILVADLELHNKAEIYIDDPSSLQIDATHSILLTQDSFIGDLSTGLSGVTIDTPTMTLDDSTVAGLIFGKVLGASVAPIYINADSLSILNGAHITSATSQSDIAAGDIFITGTHLIVEGQSLLPSCPECGSLALGTFSSLAADAAAATNSNAGTIHVDMQSVDVKNGGRITAVAFGAGNAGTIVMCCGTTFSVEAAGSEVVAGSAPGSTGNAGRILISADAVSVSDGGRIAVATEGTGHAGEIDIRTGMLTASGQSSGFTVSGASSASGSGAGRIAIEAGTFLLQGGAVVTTDTAGTSPAGQIDIRAGEFTVSGAQTRVASSATGSSGGNAGDITIGAYDITFKDGATLSTFSQAGGGGNIVLDWNNITQIIGSTVSTEVKSGDLDSGNIYFAQKPLPSLGFDAVFLAFCQHLLDIYKGKPKYDPNYTGPKILVIDDSTVTCENSGGGHACRPPTDPDVLCTGAGCNNVDTKSVEYPPNGNTHFATFAPPTAIIVPERSIATRCTAAHQQSALVDNYTGAMAVADDPAKLRPFGLPPSDPSTIITAAADRLCSSAGG